MEELALRLGRLADDLAAQATRRSQAARAANATRRAQREARADAPHPTPGLRLGPVANGRADQLSQQGVCCDCGRAISAGCGQCADCSVRECQ